MVKEKAVEAEWKYLDVNEHWQQMKNIMIETAQVTWDCHKAHPGIRKQGGGAEAVREKKKKYGNWKKEKSTEAWTEYKKSKQNANRVICLPKGKKQRNVQAI